MSFQSLLDAGNEHKINIVIGFSDPITYFSKHQVDSGLVVPIDNVGLVDQVTVNPTQIDLTRIKSSTNTTNILIKDAAENNDLDQIFTRYMSAAKNTLIDEDVVVYIGMNTGDFDFADYVKLNDYTITQMTLKDSKYKIKAQSKSLDMRFPIFNVKARLTGGIDDVIQTITVATPTDVFEDANFLRINEEIIQYTASNKTFAGNVTVFTNVIRGALGSTAESHSADAEAKQMTLLEDNPVDMFLRILLSGNGTSVYDTLHDGLAFPDNKVNTADIESKRDIFFAIDTFRLYLSDIENALEYLEAEILLPNNLRLTDTSDGISVAVLDQSVPGAPLPILNEDNTRNSDNWKISRNKIINKVRVSYDWDEATEQFLSSGVFKDDISIAEFGVKEGNEFEFKGVQSDLNGGNILVDRMGRFLARFGTPQVEIQTTSFLQRYEPNPGDKVSFESPEIPTPGGGLGLSTELEVLSKAINMATGQVRFKLVFTSYFNIRRGLIAPSPHIVSVTSQKVFEVPDATCYGVGFFLQLWDDENSVYYADIPNEVDSINYATNEITMVNDFVTVLTTDVRVKFPEYDDSSAAQIARYAYTSPNSGIFFDGTNSYQILF